MILSALEYVPLTAPHAPQDIGETQFVCDYIAGKHTRDEFFATFHPNAMSKGFNPDEDLQSIGIANQTTMLKVSACVRSKVTAGMQGVLQQWERGRGGFSPAEV